MLLTGPMKEMPPALNATDGCVAICSITVGASDPGWLLRKEDRKQRPSSRLCFCCVSSACLLHGCVLDKFARIEEALWVKEGLEAAHPGHAGAMLFEHEATLHQ